MDATLIAGLAGLLGLMLGRFWDYRSEAARWRRDQRIRIYEQIGSTYYATREAIRTMALVEHGTDKAAEAAFRALDAGAEFSRAIVAVWLHGSAPVATAVREINRELVKLFLTARAQQLSYEEWRVTRGPAEQALERFVEAVRAELALHNLLSRYGSPILAHHLEVRSDDLLGCEGRFHALSSTGLHCRRSRHLGVCVRPDCLLLEVVGKFVPSVFLQWSRDQPSSGELGTDAATCETVWRQL